MRRVRKCDPYGRRAFTLVELIVILVILAVIAAALVPALTGYVKRARKVKSLSKADAARLAAQSEFAEFYGMYGSDIDGSLDHSVNSATNVNWYSGKSAMFGDRVLELMGYSRGDDNGEPYILVIGVGHDEAPGLTDVERTTIYYVGYIEDLGSPSLFYVNGEWTTKWPRDNGALSSGDRLVNNGNGYARNTLQTADGRSIPLRFYIVSNRSGNENIGLITSGHRLTVRFRETVTVTVWVDQ